MNQVLKMGISARFALSTLVMLGGIGVGCGKGQADSPKTMRAAVFGEVVLGCGPTEQQHQFLEPLPRQSLFPKQEGIRINYKKSEFSPAEETELEAAVQEWNSFSQTKFGKPVYTIEVDTENAHVPYTSAMGCDFSGDAGVITVVRAKDDAEWAGAGMPSNSPGVTLRCSIDGQGLQKQILLLGPNSGRAGGAEQFQSVVLHELGHALGLDHSCDIDDTTENRVHCAGLADDSAFKKAVMFPYLMVTFFEGQDRHEAEIKELLTPNDEERAQCILQAR